MSKLEFLLIGKETEHIKKLIIKQKLRILPKNIKFVGYSDEPLDCISKVNILVNFSHFAESFGRTVAEALAAIRPVICYRWGALPELVHHEENGFLITYKNNHEAINYLEMLCIDNTLIKIMGENGRQSIIEKYSLEYYKNKINSTLDIISEDSKNNIKKEINKNVALIIES